MRQHEAQSQILKNCTLLLLALGHWQVKLDIILVRFSLKDLEREFEKTEDDIKAIQSVGQIIAEVLKQLDDERCKIQSYHYGFD